MAEKFTVIETHKLYYYNLIDWPSGREKNQFHKAIELMILKMELTCSLTEWTKWTMFFTVWMICKTKDYDIERHEEQH